MGGVSIAWTAVFVIWAILGVFQPLVVSQEQDARINHLLSSDPAVRSTTKNELMRHPDTAILPALLKALPSSQGSIRDDLLEILDKYDDARKLPIFMGLLKPFHLDTDSSLIGQQLARLGEPAAQAVLAGCDDPTEGYSEWAAGVLKDMETVGRASIIAALLSNDDCRREIGRNGLQWAFGEADPNSVLNADIRLASTAATDTDQRIRGATKKWFESWRGREDSVEMSGIVDALITEYQSHAPPETMPKIAAMLSDTERPRVTRFMRAALHAPNPEIQRIANHYLEHFGSKSK